MGDPRVEKLIVAIGGNPEFEVWRRVYTHQVEAFEAAGLIVLDQETHRARLASAWAQGRDEGVAETKWALISGGPSGPVRNPYQLEEDRG